MNWNLWLAQVAWRGYHADWINRIAWRETSIGELGNFGPHSANMAFMALNVKDLWDADTDDATIRIESECSEVNHLSYPRWERIRWSIPARGSQPPVTFTWYHGYKPDYAPGTRNMLGELLLDHGATREELETLLPDAGCLIVGSEGLLATTSHNTKFVLLPKKKFDHVEQGRPLTMPLSPGHTVVCQVFSDPVLTGATASLRLWRSLPPEWAVGERRFNTIEVDDQGAIRYRSSRHERCANTLSMR